MPDVRRMQRSPLVKIRYELTKRVSLLNMPCSLSLAISPCRSVTANVEP